MTDDETLKRLGLIVESDQRESHLREVARGVAIYYKALVEEGMPEWYAARLAEVLQGRLLGVVFATRRKRRS